MYLPLLITQGYRPICTLSPLPTCHINQVSTKWEDECIVFHTLESFCTHFLGFLIHSSTVFRATCFTSKIYAHSPFPWINLKKLFATSYFEKKNGFFILRPRFDFGNANFFHETREKHFFSYFPDQINL